MTRSGLKHTSYNKVIKYAQKRGFEINQGKRHAIATNEEGVLISIPRHNKISTGVTNKIAMQFIEECGCDINEVYRALKK